MVELYFLLKKCGFKSLTCQILNCEALDLPMEARWQNKNFYDLLFEIENREKGKLYLYIVMRSKRSLRAAGI